MKLSKDQRFTAYCIMAQEAQDEGIHFCFCPTIEEILHIDFCRLKTIKEYLPELHDKKPEYVSDVSIWFPETKKGLQKRIELLKQCIEETHP